MQLLAAVPFVALSLIIFVFCVVAMNTFDSLDSATRARENLNGADIYSGCCTLKIDFAKVSVSSDSHYYYIISACHNLKTLLI